MTTADHIRIVEAARAGPGRIAVTVPRESLRVVLFVAKAVEKWRRRWPAAAKEVERAA
jgi:hypothetical protein